MSLSADSTRRRLDTSRQQLIVHWTSRSPIGKSSFECRQPLPFACRHFLAHCSATPSFRQAPDNLKQSKPRIMSLFVCKVKIKMSHVRTCTCSTCSCRVIGTLAGYGASSDTVRQLDTQLHVRAHIFEAYCHLPSFEIS